MELYLFTILAVGLGQWESKGYTYPYPEVLQYGMNMLSARLFTRYPRTIETLLDLFEQPLSEWWGWELPQEIDPRFSLLTDRRLDEQTLEFLFQDDLPNFADNSLEQIAVHEDNKLIRELLDLACNAYETDPEQAEEDYVQARRFLIEHPYTTPDEFHSLLSRSPFRNQLMSMYQDVESMHYSLTIQTRRDDEAYWCCPACGILRVQDNEPVSVKPSTCRVRCPGRGEWRSIKPNRNLRILRPGIQLRTLIPGVAELQLYDWLKSLSDAYPVIITQISPWPGIDRYDIRIGFRDGDVWAVDIKDYRSPAMLGKEISKTPIYDFEERISWKHGFYLIPADREIAVPDYVTVVKNKARFKGSRIKIMSTGEFETAIQNKLMELQRNVRPE